MPENSKSRDWHEIQAIALSLSVLAGGKLREDKLGKGLSLTENIHIPGTDSRYADLQHPLVEPWVCHSGGFSIAVSSGRLQDKAVCPLCHAQEGDLVGGSCVHISCSCSAASRDPEASLSRSSSCPRCQDLLPGKSHGSREWQEGLQMASLNPKNLPQCERHMKQVQLLFCEDHGELICLICRLSQEHRGHRVRPIEEAALEYKVGLPALGPFSAGCLNTSGGFPGTLGTGALGSICGL